MASLSLEQITFAYHSGQPVFRKLDMKLDARDKGLICGVMGKSGSGKSTLFKLILGLEKPIVGRVILKPEKPVFAYLPQDPVLFEHLSIGQNARYLQSIRALNTKFDERLYQEAADILGLMELVQGSQRIDQLSGGQRQRLSLLRALSVCPDILLLDEPTNGLDSDAKMQFLELLRRVTDRYRLLVIYITHNRAETELIANELVYLYPDATSPGTNAIFQGKLNSFLDTPPHLEILKAFKYPSPLLLHCRLASDNLLVSPEVMDGDGIILSPEPAQIEFQAPAGFPAEILSSNGRYSTIGMLGSSQRLILRSELLPQYGALCIAIRGTVPAYGSDQVFQKYLEIEHNRIIG